MSTTAGSQSSESSSDEQDGMGSATDSDSETDLEIGTESWTTSMPGPYSFEPMISDSESLPDGDVSNDDEERDLSWYGKARFILYRLFFFSFFF